MAYQNDFISEIAPVIVRVAKAYGYKYPSVVIAQACVESAYGKSRLATQYYNFFGLKAGSAWQGASVNLATKEEYKAGTLTEIKDYFRIYTSLEAGVRGYFEFIKASRYANLKTASSAKDYLEKIKADGYATSSTYVSTVWGVVTNFNLTSYDGDSVQIPEPEAGVSYTHAEVSYAVDVLARACVAGFFGNGHTKRKEAIYKLIREKVNEIC